MGKKKKKSSWSNPLVWILLFLLLGAIAVWGLYSNWWGLAGQPASSGSSGTTCCNQVGLGANQTFTVDDNASMYIGYVEAVVGTVNPSTYDLIKDNNWTEDEYLTCMNDTFPAANASKFAYGLDILCDARAAFDFAQYCNLSMDGKNTTFCHSGVVVIPELIIGVFYANGTEYGTYAVHLYSGAASDYASLICDPDFKAVAICGNSLSITVNSMVTDISGDGTFNIDINGVDGNYSSA